MTKKGNVYFTNINVVLSFSTLFRAEKTSKQETKKSKVKESGIEMFSRDGDSGTSKIVTGELLPKDNPIFNAIGATEELLCSIG